MLFAFLPGGDVYKRQILDKVEQTVPFGELLGTIGVFAGALIVLAALQSYVEENMSFAKQALRCLNFPQWATKKWTETSYPNLMDPNFGEKKARVIGAYCNQDSAVEKIWEVWMQIIASILRLILYLGPVSYTHLYIQKRKKKNLP